jgi:hypothetical protein
MKRLPSANAFFKKSSKNKFFGQGALNSRSRRDVGLDLPNPNVDTTEHVN